MFTESSVIWILQQGRYHKTVTDKISSYQSPGELVWIGSTRQVVLHSLRRLWPWWVCNPKSQTTHVILYMVSQYYRIHTNKTVGKYKRKTCKQNNVYARSNLFEMSFCLLYGIHTLFPIESLTRIIPINMLLPSKVW